VTRAAKKETGMMRYLSAHLRLSSAILLGFFLLLFLPQEWRHITRILIAWDSATGLYLVLVAEMICSSGRKDIRTRAALQDDGSVFILCLTTFTAIASLAAIVAELATAKTLSGAEQMQHVGLAVLTVFLSWTFMQTMFALHYAHEYYNSFDKYPSGGLEFPAKFVEPDYWDFIYYSFIIGTAAATADINITSGTIRKITTLHCIIVFFFNTSILALTVNIGASLF
jgi:uncharacterized membrane protein